MRITRIARYLLLSLAALTAATTASAQDSRTAKQLTPAQPTIAFASSDVFAKYFAPSTSAAETKAAAKSNVSTRRAAKTFTISLLGSYSVGEGASGYWYTNNSGGTAPYSYVWTVNGNYAGSSSTLWRNMYGKGTSYVGVAVTDANGQRAEATMSVTVY